jgi:hypothetical protein
MGKTFLRQSTCNQCSYGQAIGGDYKIAYCKKTKRKGKASRACYCEKFEGRLKTSDNRVSDLGFMYRSKQVEDYRTRLQWEDAGYRVKDGIQGHEMHASMMSSKTYIYFLPDEVEPMESGANVEPCCANCSIREGRYCIVMGDYLKDLSKRCGEWDG